MKTKSSPSRAFVPDVLAGYMVSPGLFALVVLGMSYQAGFNLFVPLMTRHVFDSVLPAHDAAGLRVVAISLVAALAGRVVVSTSQEWWMARLAARAMAARRAQMFERLQSQPSVFFGKFSAGDVLARFSSDLSVVETATSRALPRAMYSLINVVGGIGLMAAMDVRLAAGVLGLLTIAFLGPRRLSAGAVARNAARRDIESKLLVAVQESVALQAVVRALGLQPWTRRSYDDKLETYRADVTRATFASSAAETFTVVILSCVQLVVLCVGALLVIRDDMTAGQLIAYTTLIGTVAGNTFGLSSTLPPLIEGAGGLARINELFGDRVKPTGSEELPPVRGSIRLEDVTFSYAGERKVLHDLTLDIPAGSSAAFVGPSGSGKSTVLSMITRTNAPESGRVRIDGHDIASVKAESLYGQMAIVAQESLLFDTTIRENIRTGRLDATDAEIEQAARKAEIHDAIVAMPRGYDTPVGERGAQLSGGQRQRVAIARAMVRDPRLLVLDEATSALDPGTEAAVSKTLVEFGRGRTVLAVTHRLSTVADFDCIFVLRDGVLVERGSHQELLARAGVYRQLWDKQQGVSVKGANQATLTPALLATIPLFAALDDQARTRLASCFVSMTYGRDHELFRIGDPGDAFYVIARGQVVIELPNGVTRVLGDGDSFGEIALLDSRPRTATARARTDCTMLLLPRQPFHDLLEQEPAIAAALQKKAADYLSVTDGPSIGETSRSPGSDHPRR